MSIKAVKHLNFKECCFLIVTVTLGFLTVNYIISPNSYALNKFNWLFLVFIFSTVIYCQYQLNRTTFIENFKIGSYLFASSLLVIIGMKIIMFNFIDDSLKDIYVENQVEELRSINQNFENQHKGYKISVEYEKEREDILKKLSIPYMLLYSIMDVLSALFQSLLASGLFVILRKTTIK